MLDGQTVKTKNLYEAISDLYGEKNIKIIDTYNVKFRFPIVLFLIIRAFLSCESVIMLPAHNGIKIFAPFFYILKKIFRKKTYYCVIGGWLPSFLADKPRLCDSLKSFDGIFVETNTMKSALCEYEFENVIVLPNFKKLQIIDPSDITVDSAFPLRLCTFSRVMKEKGIDQYLEAAKVIRKKYPQTRFHVCGACEPEYNGELQKLVDDKTIIYHGLVKDIIAIHRVTHCTVHPTYYPEGMSNVLLEACASGRPIITTDRAGCREIIDDGVNGFVVQQKDSNDLIDKLEKFINLSYEQKKAMGLAARTKVEKEFDRKIVVRKYLDEVLRYIV